MLRAQIPVRVHDLPLACPFLQYLSMPSGKAAQRVGGRLDLRRGQSVARLQHRFRVGGYVLGQTPAIGGGLDFDGRGLAVERGEVLCEIADRLLLDPVVQDRRFKRCRRRQPDHLHQVLDGLAFAEPKPGFAVLAERHDADIDAGRQIAVQPDLFLAKMLPALQRGEIQKGRFHGFLQLEGVAIGHEDPGHMRFPRLDRARRFRIARRRR